MAAVGPYFSIGLAISAEVGYPPIIAVGVKIQSKYTTVS